MTTTFLLVVNALLSLVATVDRAALLSVANRWKPMNFASSKGKHVVSFNGGIQRYAKMIITCQNASYGIVHIADQHEHMSVFAIDSSHNIVSSLTTQPKTEFFATLYTVIEWHGRTFDVPLNCNDPYIDSQEIFEAFFAHGDQNDDEDSNETKFDI